MYIHIIIFLDVKIKVRELYCSKVPGRWPAIINIRHDHQSFEPF